MDTGFAAQEWLRSQSKMSPSTLRKRYTNIWRKRAAGSNAPTSGSDRGGRHHGGHDHIKMVSNLLEVIEQSKPDIPHMSGPGCLMEDRPTHSIDEIVDAVELKTMEGNEDEYLLCRQEVERGDPYGGDGKGVSRYTCSSGDGSLNKVGSDESSSSLSLSRLRKQVLGAITAAACTTSALAHRHCSVM